MRRLFVGAFAIAVFSVVGSGTARAATVICTEDASGCVADVFSGGFPGFEILVASDGESAFDPFGAGFDTSDGIQFAAGYAGIGVTWTSYGPGFAYWVQTGAQTWVLPAVLGNCGAENEPACEPHGSWFASGGAAWIPSVLGDYVMIDPDGSIGDLIRLCNCGPGGAASIAFYSDPIPEPATMTLLGLGLIGVGRRVSRNLGARVRS
jgi:hypothetical protein